MLALAATTAGCRFWYKPVPVANAIGEEKTVLAGDTVNVYRGDRFEVYGPSSEAVYDGYEQLNRAYRAFEKHFEVQPLKLAFLLARDTAAMVLDSAVTKTFRDRGLYVVRYVRPRSMRNRRYAGIDYGGLTWPIAPTAARLMLVRFADRQLPSNTSRDDETVLERFPFWYRAAALNLIGLAALPIADIEFLRDHRAQWMPLRDLLVMVRPAAADTAFDPLRRQDVDELTRVVVAQSTAFGRFLAEREGPAVIGRLGRGYLAGRSLTEMTAEFRSAPRTVAELESRFRGWIDSHED